MYLPITIHALGLFGCENITSQAVRKLIRACPHLLMIGLENCLLPLHAFPEVTGREGRYVQILRYADIMAIRSNPDINIIADLDVDGSDNDMDMGMDVEDNDGNGMNMNNNNAGMDQNHLHGTGDDYGRTAIAEIQGNETSDDMDEVRALVLSLADNTHYSI